MLASLMLTIAILTDHGFSVVLTDPEDLWEWCESNGVTAVCHGCRTVYAEGGEDALTCCPDADGFHTD